MTERAAFITGVSRGIGAALATSFAARGFSVYGCATTLDAIPDGVIGFACDVSNPDQVERMFQELREHTTRLDVLVNNAGLLGPRTTIENVEPAQWRRVFEVNATGPFLVSRAALPFLREASGTIVMISSSVGRKGRGGWGPYACSKHALEGLTDTLADELRADEIVVMSMNPGGTATDMRAEAFPEEEPASLPTAQQVAETIADAATAATLEQTGAKLNCRDFL